MIARILLPLAVLGALALAVAFVFVVFV